MELLVLGLVASIGFASYALWSKARSSEQPPRPTPELEPPERTVANLQVGDVVQHLGTDWVVEGVLTLCDAGRGARLYRLVDGAEECFLFAASGPPNADEAEPALLRAAPEVAPELAGGGPPEELELAGHAYRLKARESASVLRTGAVGERRAGDRVRFASYAAGALRLLLLHWGDHVDAFIGERVPTHLLDLLPGR